MPNFVQYSTSNLTGSLRKGNVALGVTTASILGPTSTTNWYTGITPASGKYVIYKTAATGDPDIFTPQSTQELYNFVIMQGGTSSDILSVSSSLAWIGTQSNLLAVAFDYENIVTNGLTINLDAGFVGSYPTTGTSIYDLSGNAVNGTLTNSPAFNSSNSGSLLFNSTNNYVNCGSSFTSLDLISKSFCAWVNLSASLNNPTGIIDKDFDNGAPNYGGWGFWVGSDRKLWWWNQGGLDIRDTGATTIGTNAWTHIAVTYDSSTKTASFYINATLNSTGSNASIVEKSSGTALLTVSGIRNGVAGGIINGSVANVLAYNRVLSATEITQNYNAQKGRFGL